MKWFRIFAVAGITAALAACGGGGQGQLQVGKVSISPTKVEVGANQSKSLSATVRDTAGNSLSNVEVSWEVMDGDVAKVVSKGKLAATLTGLKSGQTEVIAVVSGVESVPAQIVVSGSDPTPSARGLSGTVYAPQGGSVKGSLVIACVVVEQSCDTKDTRTKAISIATSGASASFSLEVVNANYVVVGLKDVNGNGAFDDGDYYGCIGGGANGDCAILTPPKQGLELRMEASSNPAPTEGSISGQLFAAKGNNLSGAIVAACDANTSKCISNQYGGTATQTPYTLKVPSSQYAVFGWRDVNKNSKVDAGDDFGCAMNAAGNDCDLVDVRGAVSGKDIHLSTLSGAGVQSLSQGFKIENPSLPIATPEQFGKFIQK